MLDITQKYIDKVNEISATTGLPVVSLCEAVESALPIQEIRICLFIRFTCFSNMCTYIVICINPL